VVGRRISSPAYHSIRLLVALRYNVRDEALLTTATLECILHVKLR